MRTRRAFLASTAAAAVFLAGAAPARAAQCRITNVTPLSFGGYDMTSTMPLDSTGELAVDCDAFTPVRITMGRGNAAKQNPREMTSRGQSLLYNIFIDAARTLIWGDGSEGTQAFMGVVPMAQPLRLPIFGRVFPLQGVPTGTYSDRVHVSVIF